MTAQHHHHQMHNFSKILEAKKQKVLGTTSGIKELELFRLLRDKPFWYCWDDKEAHQQEYERTGGLCCFNHILLLPFKNNIRHPLFDYQKDWFDSLEKS